jgi:hypothetical protein
MFRGRSFAAVVIAVVITAGLAVYGSGQAASAATQAGRQHRAPAAPLCLHFANLQGWSGIYWACRSFNGTYLQVTNTSVWDVLELQVPQGELLPLMTISAPNTGSGLLNLAEEEEIPHPNGGSYALVPPGSTLIATAWSDEPLRMLISVNYAETALDVTAAGLVDAVKDHVAPGWSEAESIVSCAESVHSLPRQINQWLPSTVQFWNSFAQVASCYSAFRGWSEAIGGGGEKAVIKGAEVATDSFWDDLLPDLVDFIDETIFHLDL